MSAITNASLQSEQVAPISKLWWVGLVAAGVAATVNVIFFTITKTLGVPYIMPVQGPGSPLEILPVEIVVISSIAPAIGATILYLILGKFLSRPVRIFLIISIIFWVISFIPPLTLPTSVTVSTKASLCAMHVLAGTVIVGVLTTIGRKR